MYKKINTKRQEKYTMKAGPNNVVRYIHSSFSNACDALLFHRVAISSGVSPFWKINVFVKYLNYTQFVKRNNR